MIRDWYLIKHSIVKGQGYIEGQILETGWGFKDKDKQHCIIIDIVVTNTGVIINHVTLKEVNSDH